LSSTGGWTATSGTTWTWRAGNGTGSYAVGGAILEDKANGVFVFLPASGYRHDSSGALYNIGTYGYYWSSTYISTCYSYRLTFNSGDVDAGSGNVSKAFGRSVRCAAEY
jgi:hypothetical protein